MISFFKEVQVRFPDYKLTPLGNTTHTNVVRLSKEGYPSLVAKTIWHDISEPDGDMGIKAQDNAYKTEVKILSMLPPWWGIQLIDHFKTNMNRVIITNEVVNVPWSSYKGNDRLMATILSKQIKWLHLHKIAHNDLELKNILLTEKGCIIIDFEKATFMSSKENMYHDYSLLLANMKEIPSTKNIGKMLQYISKGGSLRRTKHSKYRFTQKR
jgi:tRNA A-37 threonylcarbamoyl transferase component Bud32